MVPGTATDPVAATLVGMAAADGIGTILYLGAGRTAGAAAWLDAGAGHVALVEPDPGNVQALQRQAGAEARIAVHACAVAERDGTARLQLFNHAPLSSLRAPADLGVLFPGLRRLREVEVETASPATLAARLPPAGPLPDLLIVDAPGEEAVAIAGLEAAGALHRFGRILLRCGTTEHYAGSLPLAALTARLEQAGYRAEAVGGDDPDRPWSRFRLEPLALENGEMRARLEAQAAEIDQLHTAVRQEQAHHAETREEMTRQIAERQAELDRMTAETAQADAALQQAEQRLGAREEALQAALAARDALAEELRASRVEGDRLAVERDARAGEAEGLRAQAGQLQAALDQARKEAGELAEWRRAAEDAQQARDRLAAETDRMQALIAEQQGALERLRAELAETGARAAQASLERDAAEAALQQTHDSAHSHEVALQEVCAARDALAEEVRQARGHIERQAADLADLRKMADATVAERDQQAAQVDRLRARIAEQQGALEQLRTEFAAQKAAAADVVAARDALQSRLQEQGAALQQARKDAADAKASSQALVVRLETEAQETARARQEQVEGLRNDMAMAVRLQALREDDLRDLQHRYALLMDEKDRQDVLLRQLTERLGIAAQYLQHLEDEPETAPAARALGGPDGDGETPEDRPVPARSAPAGHKRAKGRKRKKP